jgi:hypothetical protein
MVTAFLRLLLHVILSPRRLLIAALLATFCCAAVVATKARFLPEPAPAAGRVTRPGGQVDAASRRTSSNRVPVAHRTLGE